MMAGLCRAQQTDWAHFLSLASEEGWRVPRMERRLFTGSWSQYALALYDGSRFCGLVTAVPHQRSGWIGNLIVPPQLRGRGYGRRLFRAALARLLEQGVESVWLTASEQGRPLYEGEGFVTVDSIERWIMPSPAGAGSSTGEVDYSRALLEKADQAAWNEQRTALLSALAEASLALSLGGATALLQKEPGLQLVGPWYATRTDSASNRRLLMTLLAEADPGSPVVIDAFTSSTAPQLCASTGFQCSGKTSLMVYGARQSVKLHSMMALASLGSFG